MPLPLLAIAGRFLAGAALRGNDSGPPVPVPALTFKWSKGGRGIRKRADRIKVNVRTATRRAVNAVGKDVANEMARIVADKTGATLTIGARTLKRQSARPGRPNPTYTIAITRAVPLRSIKGRKSFKPYPGGARRGPKKGSLTIHQIGGKRVVFQGVESKRGRFTLPETPERGARGVGGLRVRVDSTPEIRALRRTIPKRFKRALRVELARPSMR